MPWKKTHAVSERHHLVNKRFVQRAEHSIATSLQASHCDTITQVNSSRMHFKMSCDSSAFDRVRPSSEVQKETFEHPRSNCSGSHDSPVSKNCTPRCRNSLIVSTTFGSSGVLATRRPRSTDAVSSWRPRDLFKHLCQQWDPVRSRPDSVPSVWRHFPWRVKRLQDVQSR